MKIIIIGTSLSGKTSLIKYLKSQDGTLPIAEMDELLTQGNGGMFPTDIEYKNKILGPKIVENILHKNNILFFTNTDYFTLDDLKNARERGFKIIQLVLNIEDLKKRNEFRMKNEGYEDHSRWFEGMLKYQEEIKSAGLVDKTLDATLSTADLSLELMKLIKTTL